MEYCLLEEKEIELEYYGNTKSNSLCKGCPYLGVCASNKFNLMENEDPSNYEITNLAERDTVNKEGFQIVFDDSDLIDDLDSEEEENNTLDYLEDAEGEDFLKENFDDEDDEEELALVKKEESKVTKGKEKSEPKEEKDKKKQDKSKPTSKYDKLSAIADEFDF